MDEIELGDVAAGLGLDEDLAHEQGDRPDRAGDREQPDERKVRVRQAGVDAVPDGPRLHLAGQRGERLDRIVGHDVIELADEPLVGAEDHGADGHRVRARLLLDGGGRWGVLVETRAQPQLDGSRVVGQGPNRFLVLADARGRQALHRTHDGLQIAGAIDLASKARRRIAHGAPLGGRWVSPALPDVRTAARVCCRSREPASRPPRRRPGPPCPRRA